ncbi:MAG TPA: asparagine synthase (glutamine-hydrolyzing) [Anaerohalosphaeraceae bacterium]|nr:asparagine synthase (glutamine-hydrolyzing) [Anaerohalosphaeraceae bacterium]
MCGIAGYFNHAKTRTDLSGLYKAVRLIAHRGPDDEGYAVFNMDTQTAQKYCGPDSPAVLKSQMPDIVQHPHFAHHLAFGFRRFSIVDLSEKGHQPFWSPDGSVCLIFNGEIYNYIELQKELLQLGYCFTTACDTEVLLAGYLTWGMDVLKFCNGPIAMVCYDRRKNTLLMARDRLGKAPLYYAVHQGTLYWASEIKSILSLTGHSAFSINEQAVYDYLNYGWRDLDNTTFWNGVCTLPAAHWTEIDVASQPSYDQINASLHRYWDFPPQRLHPGQIPFREAVGRFRELFTDAVRIRARADAKVAFSLSGGLDSSSITAAAAHIADQSFRTYSIKFPGQDCDEEPFARKVYELYPDKIDYHIYTPANEDFWQVASDFIWLQEEPFHWPSAELFQAYFRHARRQDYKVILIGTGGDELLAGYNDYFFPLLMYWRKNSRFLPLAANLFLKEDIWPKYCIRQRIKIFNALFHNRFDALRRYIPVSFFNAGGQEVAAGYLRGPLASGSYQKHKQIAPTDFQALAVGYMSNWLMNYWLRNSNRAHFGVPIESRSPFLDYRLVDFVFTLPPEYMVHNGWTKYILRKAMAQWLPSEVSWRRIKQGMPFNTLPWFNHAKPIVEALLRNTAQNPYLDTAQLFNDYDRLLRENPYFLWRGINFCLWWKRVILLSPLPIPAGTTS